MAPIYIAICVGFLATIYLYFMFTAGHRNPSQRRWPPMVISFTTIVEIWGAASAVFVAVYVLGALDAGRVNWPGWVRFGLGVPLLIAGNIAVSLGIAQLGFMQTSGQAGPLKRNGVYAWSRHPQYLGHLCALTGWVIYTGSLWSIPMLMAAAYALRLAIRGEETWFMHDDAPAYAAYRQSVRCLI